MDVNLNDVYKPIPFVSEVCESLKYLAETLGKVNLSPAYQRGSVWTLEQRENFLGHLMQGGEVAPLIVQRKVSGPDGKEEMIDGKQRAEAILAWLSGVVGARLDDGSLVMRGDVVVGLGRVEIRIRYVDLPWAKRVRYYARLNSAGTPHTQEQIVAALSAKESP